jgi:hypothetical protein
MGLSVTSFLDISLVLIISSLRPRSPSSCRVPLISDDVPKHRREEVCDHFAISTGATSGGVKSRSRRNVAVARTFGSNNSSTSRRTRPGVEGKRRHEGMEAVVMVVSVSVIALVVRLIVSVKVHHIYGAWVIVTFNLMTC